ncbi:MAG: methyltransferase domain-containing protein [Proteobacteria bacterium]|nr:methyltransferase domain-containing protein [Pseudomonadota bacterium]MBU1710144.1 methyltransferase domain-containing protein [Pseudomonadota bacterium]
MDEKELKEFYKKTFNTVATGYDSSAMRFFTESAGKIPSHLNLKGDEHVLDVATGTGNIALSLCQHLPEGHVTGIDLSEGMLAEALKKMQEGNIRNVTFHEMDMQAIDFPDSFFDLGVSAFSLFFVTDMEKQLQHIAQKIKKGGQILITTFYDDSFSPLVNIFFADLERYGVQVPNIAWKRVATRKQCMDLFGKAGLSNISCHQVESGYYLQSPSDWWYIVWNGGFRGLVNQVAPQNQDRFKKEHLEKIEKLATDDGLWLEMSILYTIGTRN